MRLPSTVFETVASAIPPLRLMKSKLQAGVGCLHLAHFGRGERIRTSGLNNPIVARYQAAPRPAAWHAGQESNLQPAVLETAALPN